MVMPEIVIEIELFGVYLGSLDLLHDKPRLH
jgi:hypothetical protein